MPKQIAIGSTKLLAKARAEDLLRYAARRHNCEISGEIDVKIDPITSGRHDGAYKATASAAFRKKRK
jgi:hypothetical protein